MKYITVTSPDGQIIYANSCWTYQNGQNEYFVGFNAGVSRLAEPLYVQLTDSDAPFSQEIALATEKLFNERLSVGGEIDFRKKADWEKIYTYAGQLLDESLQRELQKTTEKLLQEWSELISRLEEAKWERLRECEQQSVLF